MEVVARHQFYLPYLLPRAPDWSDKPISIRFDDATVHIRGKTIDEPLFPLEIDKTLFEMRVDIAKASPLLAGTAFISVRERCFDRLQVDVFLELDTLDQALLEATHDKALYAALDAANIFLAHCRILTKSVGIRPIERQYKPADGKFYVVCPRTVTWARTDTSKGIPAYPEANYASATASSGSIPFVLPSSIPLVKVVESIRSSENPPLPYTLLADAVWLLTTLAKREAILNAATACEIASNQYMDSHYITNPDDLADIAPSNHTFAERRYHDIPLHLSGQSLKVLHPETFRGVELLYKTRNSIAHKAVACYKDPTTGTEVHVDIKSAADLIKEAEHAVKWILALPPPNDRA